MDVELNEDLRKIIEARHHDPFSILGKHRVKDRLQVRAYLPSAENVSISGSDTPMQQIADSRVFQWEGDIDSLQEPYTLTWRDSENKQHQEYDPYAFPPQISNDDLYFFGQGKHWRAQQFLGANKWEVDGIWGTLFAVWAPNAQRVSVVGDFNHWDGRRHPMRSRDQSGIWELFMPGLHADQLYKFEIRLHESGQVFLKSDPYAKRTELRPLTASVIDEAHDYPWQDQLWMAKRVNWDWQHEPISIYEVQLGSWQRPEHGGFSNYRELAHQLVPYVQKMGFTHIEILPILEYPYDPSWGYQITGFFSPTRRFGNPDDLRYFIDYFHKHNIGVFLDWVPAHFPKDAHGLARFDGSALYEHADPRLGEHMDWDTLIFNYSRNEVRCFLFSSALHWLESFHFDGLRVDAVASMLYRDYSRTDWLPNEFGGRENIEAIHFLQELNWIVHQNCPGAMMMAEESTSWPQVTQPTETGGLGFNLKWNMGWMNDTLCYWEQDPINRKYHHNKLTFSMIYAFSENFILPFSHDEVVHGKQSMLNKMPGDDWQKFANLRLLYTYMFTHPGKKLLFMGCEFAQGLEWNAEQELNWYVLDYPNHQGIQNLVKDLNLLYQQHKALYQYDFKWQKFEWLDCHDAQQSIISFCRHSDHETIVVVCNLTPVPRHGYRLGVPLEGFYQEIFNSDSNLYDGSNIGNGIHRPQTQSIAWMDRPQSIHIDLPPLGALVFKHSYD